MALISKSAMVRSSLALVRSLHGAESAELALAQSTDNPEILAPSSEASRERLRTLVFRKCQAKKREHFTHTYTEEEEKAERRRVEAVSLPFGSSGFSRRKRQRKKRSNLSEFSKKYKKWSLIRCIL